MMKTLLTVLSMPLAAFALDVNITPDIENVTVETSNGPVVIERIQDTENEITGEFARTSRDCPNFCIQPMIAADGVTTVGELEVLDALQDPEFTVLDSRVLPDYRKGTIPGSVHMPYTEMADRLDEFGCEIDFEGFICEDAPKLLLFCNGPWCGQSPTAIKRAIAAGYPADKLYYYRGGMQAWQMLGLNVVAGE